MPPALDPIGVDTLPAVLLGVAVFIWPFVVVWLLCGILTALVAQSRGRDVGGWAVLGIVFGLFGLVAVAILPPVEQPTIACPYCAERILAQAKVCRHCGREIPGRESWKPLQAQAEGEREVIAPTQLRATYSIAADTQDLLPRLGVALEGTPHFRDVWTSDSEVGAEYSTVWTAGSLRVRVTDDWEQTLLTATATPSGAVLDAFEAALATIE